MTLGIAIYAFMAMSAALAVVEDYSRKEVIASLILGLVWPLWLTSRILRKIVR